MASYPSSKDTKNLPSDGSHNLALIRIVLIGKSGCGKTSLANVLVNNVFNPNIAATQDLTTYYTILRIAGEEDQPAFNVLLEIEDTMACDGPDVTSSDMDNLYSPDWPWPKHADSAVREYECEICMTRFGTFEEMCFHEAECPRRQDTIPPLPPLEKSETDKKMKAHGRNKAVGQAEGIRAAVFPFSASRPPEIYWTRQADSRIDSGLRKNRQKDAEGMKYRPVGVRRMAYLLLFDSNDIDSYKEAQHRMQDLKEYIEKKNIKNWSPVIYLVATKIDKDESGRVYNQIMTDLSINCEAEGILHDKVSAKEYRGVKRLFRGVCNQVRMKQNLWLLQSVDDAGESNIEGKCSLQ